MKVSSICLYFGVSILPTILIGSIRAPGPLPEENFAKVASGASIVIEGSERWQEVRKHSLPSVPFGKVYGDVFFVQVDEVLACDANYVGNEGKPDIPEFIAVVNVRRRDSSMAFSEWPSILFLESVFFNQSPRYAPDLPWRAKELSAIRNMSEEHNLDLRYIFELVDPEFGVFPLISYESFDYPARGKYPDKRIWDWQKERLQKAWGLDDLTEIDPFVRKALLPFFEQVDVDWFIGKSGKMEEGEPLRRVGKALVERFEYEEKFKPTAIQHRKAIRVPFVAGSVLTNENLTGDFPSFGSSDENQNAKEAEPE